MSPSLLLRLLFVSSAGLAAVAPSTNGIAADDVACAALRAERTALPDVIGTTATVREFTRAIAGQKSALAALKAERHLLGCSTDSVEVIGGDNAEACQQSDADLAAMQDNLRTLEERKASIGSLADPRDRRAAIDARLAALDCNGNTPGGQYPLEEPTDSTSAERPKGNGYRTLCVRLCDGAYSPLSSSIAGAEMDRDLRACQIRCPSTPTALYYAPASTTDLSRFTALSDGSRYGELPTAFAFREGIGGPACSCRPAVVAPPAAGQSTAGTNLGPRRPPPERTLTDSDLAVRKVGPAFLPPSALDLRHPKQAGAQPQQP